MVLFSKLSKFSIFFPAEVELSCGPKPKRGRPSRKSFQSDGKGEDISDDLREILSSIKESEKSETETNEISNNIESDIAQLKAEELVNNPLTSNNDSSPAVTLKSRGSRLTRGASPASGGRQKVVDVTNPVYQEPFKYGWKRELVFRGTGADSSAKKMSDVYYIAPNGRKVRSFRDVSSCCE